MKIGRTRCNNVTEKVCHFANIGDAIQGVTFSYIFEKIGINSAEVIKLSKDELKEYSGEQVLLFIHIGLTNENIDKYFPISKNIEPIFVSIRVYEDVFAERKELVAYFKRHEPIGCRDEQSYNYFKKYGIESYLMGCFTICLPKRENISLKNSHPFLVDVSPELLKKIPNEIKEKAVYLSHAVPYLEYPVTIEEDERIDELAETYLKRYAEEANLVITSRLHVAVPCMCMGIPVVLAADNVDFRFQWVDKFIKIYQEEDYSSINFNPSPIELGDVREIMCNYFQETIIHKSASRECLKKLDNIYQNRDKTIYYQAFRKKLSLVKEQCDKEEKPTYAIWGGGTHAIFAYNLMNEIVPKAKLLVVLDKYKRGKKFGVPIVEGKWLHNYDVSHVLITSKAAIAEACEKCEEIWGKDSEAYYTILSSQQDS